MTNKNCNKKPARYIPSRHAMMLASGEEFIYRRGGTIIYRKRVEDLRRLMRLDLS